MDGDRLKCRDCGASLPSDARFCARCGIPAATTLDGSLEFDRHASVEITALGSTGERSRLLVVMAVVVGGSLLAWSMLTSGVDTPIDSAVSSTTATTRVSSTTTTGVVGDATTKAPESAVTEVTAGSASDQSLSESNLIQTAQLSSVPGPVLDDGVEGVVYVLSVPRQRVTLLDLGTGDIRHIGFITLTLPAWGDVVPYFDGDEMLVFDGRVLHKINLATGALPDFRRVLDRSADGWMAGLARSNSVWLVTESDSDLSSTVYEVEFDGEIIQSFEFEAPFRVHSANGTNIYLDGPGGSWVFDALNSSASALNARIIESNSEGIVLLTCEATLECEVSIEAASVSVPTSVLNAVGFISGEVHVSPDLTAAFAHTETEDGFEFSYIDLASGDRVEFGELPIEPYDAIIWIPETPWIIAVGNGASRDLVAVNTSSEVIVELDLPGTGCLCGDSIGLVPTG